MRLIGRRDFVRGLGLGVGAALLTPFARHLIQQASGQEPQDRRFVLMHSMNGLGQEATERWLPSNPDLTVSGALPPSFAPLAPWAAKTLIVDYLYNPFNPGQHGTGWASLSVRGVRPAEPPPVQQSKDVYPDPSGITVDVLAGEHLSAGAPFPTLGWATDLDRLSSDGGLNRVPGYRSASQFFTQVFGGFDPSLSQAEHEARLLRRQSVLDLARADLRRMRDRLAGPEREKLDQLESSIRATEERLVSIARSQGACTLPSGDILGVYGAGEHGGPYNPAFPEAMIDLQTTALLCRLTNVAVFSPVPSRRHYAEILGDGRFAHDMSHDDDTAALVRVDQFNAGLLATMVTRLEGALEGDGTMADRTLFAWYDENGGRHHAPGMYHDNHPIILLGDMEGHFRGGRHVRFGKGEHATSDAFVSILQALGIDVDLFGDPSVCRGPLPDLTA